MTGEQAFKKVEMEIISKQPLLEIVSACESQNSYLFNLMYKDGGEYDSFAEVNKQTGDARLVHFTTVMIEHPDIDDYPEIVLSKLRAS